MRISVSGVWDEIRSKRSFPSPYYQEGEAVSLIGHQMTRVTPEEPGHRTTSVMDSQPRHAKSATCNTAQKCTAGGCEPQEMGAGAREAASVSAELAPRVRIHP
ncbi:hypothetical protein NDU88_007463 [Pleurodeles waltl]|uniref:Uncharacterized protein n=1 Tax=Pleurodeles waltl TaxID=8319 RepID=A0AAV7SSU5_PLEWA|nr:hypothetical protein NDU88_007463 [Pleurodeles waltl]